MPFATHMSRSMCSVLVSKVKRDFYRFYFHLLFNRMKFSAINSLSSSLTKLNYMPVSCERIQCMESGVCILQLNIFKYLLNVSHSGSTIYDTSDMDHHFFLLLLQLNLKTGLIGLLTFIWNLSLELKVKCSVFIPLHDVSIEMWYEMPVCI